MISDTPSEHCSHSPCISLYFLASPGINLINIKYKNIKYWSDFVYDLFVNFRFFFERESERV